MTQQPDDWQPPGQPARPGQPGQLSTEDRTWGAAAHWSALVAAFVAMAFLGPLVVLLVKGNDSPWVRRQAVESLNFHLSMIIYSVVGGILAIIVVILTVGIGIIVVLPLALAGAAFWLVVTIVGSIKATNGEDHRYPLTIRMVS